MCSVSARALVAVLVGVAATLIGFAAPAQAAACAKGTGVTVVVNNSVSCDSSGGGRAASKFTNAGHSLKYIGNGFVCQVDGYPSECKPPNNKYWALFWSDGKSGTWTYSQSGVGSLNVPTGGWVAFKFQPDGGKAAPGVTPIGPAAPKPKPKPTTAKPTTPKPTTAKPSVTPSAKASDKAKKADEKKTSTASATPGSDETTAAGSSNDDTRITSAEVDESSSAALLWIAAVFGVGLIAAAVVIARARSQRS